MKLKIGILILVVIFCVTFFVLFYFYPQDFDFVFSDYQPTERSIDYTKETEVEKKENIYNVARKEVFDLKQRLCDKLYAQNLTSIHRYGKSCFKGDEFGYECVCYEQ